jgi:Peptidase family M23
MTTFFPTDPTLQITQLWGNVNFSLYPAPSGRHMGVDIGGLVGSPIYAASDGTVETANLVNLHGYGRHTIIRHDGYLTLYAHLHQVSVQTGQAVTGGQQIGEMGGQPGDNDPIDGASSGSHLHFEVILPAQPAIDFVKTFAGYTVDPLVYLTRLKLGEPAFFVTVIASKGVRVRTEPNVNSRQIGALGNKTTHPIIEIVQVENNYWARLWSLRDEFSAAKYEGETLMSVSPNTPVEIPADDKAARLDEINRIITFLEQRKTELFPS